GSSGRSPWERGPVSWLHAQFSFQQGGWGASLADKLVRRCDVLNRGFSGYNTRWAKIILPRLIRKGNNLDNPVVVTIFFGANDSALKDENPKQHIPLEEYVANLKSMVQYLKSVDVPEHRVILITPPPLCETAWEKECIMQGKPAMPRGIKPGHEHSKDIGRAVLPACGPCISLFSGG
uniref:1-alkyl-2-acetylglycerophosphocholine esterase n=1 Tax=Urocitellus parryii TaxID=9999 RepID=A0A8D2HNP5_UROPR